MPVKLKHIIGASLLGLSASLTQAAELEPFRALYTSKFDLGIAIKGEAVRELKRTDNGEWKLSTTAKAFIGRFEERSVFRQNQDTLVPQHYSYLRKALGKTRKASIEFDWAAQQVTNHVGKQPWQMPVEPGTLDKQSYQMQLQYDLEHNRQENYSYRVADGGKLKTYRFDVLGNENVKTPVGEFTAIKVQRNRGEDSDRETYIWFAPQLDYMIVKLLQVESDGKEYALLLKEVQQP